jgi:hypothetical protein
LELGFFLPPPGSPHFFHFFVWWVCCCCSCGWFLCVLLYFGVSHAHIRQDLRKNETERKRKRRRVQSRQETMGDDVEFVYFPNIKGTVHKLHLCVRNYDKQKYYAYRMYECKDHLGEVTWTINTKSLQMVFPLCDCRVTVEKTFEYDCVMYNRVRRHTTDCPFLTNPRTGGVFEKDAQAKVLDPLTIHPAIRRAGEAARRKLSGDEKKI